MDAVCCFLDLICVCMCLCVWKWYVQRFSVQLVAYCTMSCERYELLDVLLLNCVVNSRCCLPSVYQTESPHHLLHRFSMLFTCRYHLPFSLAAHISLVWYILTSWSLDGNFIEIVVVTALCPTNQCRIKVGQCPSKIWWIQRGAHIPARSGSSTIPQLNFISCFWFC